MTGARCSIGRRKLLCALGCTYMTLAASSFGAGGRPAMFNDTTYDELTALPPEQRMIAAIQCEDVMLLSSGSRRERVLITARLLAGADNVKFEAPLRLIRYTQRDPLVKRGQAYVVVAYPGEWLPGVESGGFQADRGIERRLCGERSDARALSACRRRSVASSRRRQRAWLSSLYRGSVAMRSLLSVSTTPLTLFDTSMARRFPRDPLRACRSA